MRRGLRGLDRNSFPMRLWQKAKKQGTWDPTAIDFTRDRKDWQEITEEQREGFLQLCALFRLGEEAVTLDLLPLIRIVASEGRLEEEMYLTSFLWEEAKHVDLFDRFFQEVSGTPRDLSRYIHSGYARIFGEELPAALQRLEEDTSPVAQVRASVTYNMVVEGIIAETGYHLFRNMLTASGRLPGMQQALELLRRDESRHIAFGLYFLSRLIAEHGNPAYKAFLDRMNELKPIVEEATEQLVAFLEGCQAPGVDREDLVRFSERRFAQRVRRITRARTQSPADLHRVGEFFEEEDLGSR